MKLVAEFPEPNKNRWDTLRPPMNKVRCRVLLQYSNLNVAPAEEMNED
jgi:hypothetical protein